MKKEDVHTFDLVIQVVPRNRAVIALRWEQRQLVSSSEIGLLVSTHQLDATLVKSYATAFCAVKILRDSTREQVEAFVTRILQSARRG